MWFENILNEYQLNNKETKIKIKEKNNREIRIYIINNNKAINPYAFFNTARKEVYNKLLMHFPNKIKDIYTNVHEASSLIPDSMFIISLKF